MKKIVITIQTASDGGAFISMDPGVQELVDDVDVGKGTTAHAYAMKAWKAMHDFAMQEGAEGASVDAGEIPPQTH